MLLLLVDYQKLLQISVIVKTSNFQILVLYFEMDQVDQILLFLTLPSCQSPSEDFTDGRLERRDRDHL